NPQPRLFPPRSSEIVSIIDSGHDPRATRTTIAAVSPNRQTALGGGLPGARYEGLGLGAFGARALLFTWGGYIVSLQAGLRAASPAARRFLDMRDPVQADLRLLVGRPFELFGFPGFVDAQLGYRSRGQNGDEIRADLTAGLRPLPAILLLAQSFSGFAPRGGPAGVVAAQKFQLSAVYDMTASLSLQIGAIAALGGVNSPAERGLISAVWWRY
ncbi:MAG: hypothetical protein ACR651_11065, partial [Methylocystis sp.]